jgi:hypothetical protein
VPATRKRALSGSCSAGVGPGDSGGDSGASAGDAHGDVGGDGGASTTARGEGGGGSLRPAAGDDSQDSCGVLVALALVPNRERFASRMVASSSRPVGRKRLGRGAWPPDAAAAKASASDMACCAGVPGGCAVAVAGPTSGDRGIDDDAVKDGIGDAMGDAKGEPLGECNGLYEQDAAPGEVGDAGTDVAAREAGDAAAAASPPLGGSGGRPALMLASSLDHAPCLWPAVLLRLLDAAVCDGRLEAGWRLLLVRP